jgi:hypothetical protein
LPDVLKIPVIRGAPEASVNVRVLLSEPHWFVAVISRANDPLSDGMPVMAQFVELTIKPLGKPFAVMAVGLLLVVIG